MDFEQIYRILSNSIVFRDLDRDELQRVLEYGVQESFAPGKHILREGEENSMLYLVLDGEVEVYLPESERRSGRIHLNVVGPEAILGEYSLIDNEPASASAVTRTEASFFYMDREDFERLVGEEDRIGKKIYYNLVRTLVQRLRDKDRELDLEIL